MTDYINNYKLTINLYFKMTKKIGKLIGLGIAGLVGLLSGCSTYEPQTSKLPNGVVVEGVIEKSKANSGYLNFRPYQNSSKIDYAQKSRLEGTITYVGFLETKEKSIEIKSITQSGDANGGIFSGGNVSNVAKIDPKDEIFIKILADPKYNNTNEWIMQVIADYGVDPSPSILLNALNNGDKVSIPTIREYDDPRNLYRVFNQIDKLRISEIKKLYP